MGAFKSFRSARTLLTTLSIAAIGGMTFDFLGLSAGWLSGAMVFTAVVTLSGIPTTMPDKLRDGLFVLLGISMGGGVRPEVVERVGEWPVTMGLLIVIVVLVTIAGYLVLRFVAHWSRETAFFGAIPGALSYVIALASERRADLPRIASTQSVRLLMLVALLPFAISPASDVGTQSAPAVPTKFQDLLFAVPLCLAASLAAVKMRLPGGWMTGAFLMSAGLNASGTFVLALPDSILIVCFIGVGALIGCRFNEMTLREFIGVLGASIGAFCAAFLTSAFGAAMVSYLVDIPFGQALLAYAPGGLEVMTLLAFMLDLDPAFVAAHQIARFTGMVLLLPAATALFLGRKQDDR